MCSSSTPSTASATTGLANQSFQTAIHSKHPVGQTAQTSMSDGPYEHDTAAASYRHSTTAATAAASTDTDTTAAGGNRATEPLLTFTAPLNDTTGHSGTCRQTTTTILPPTKRPADGSADALLDDLERWCHRQFGTALPSASGTSASASAFASSSAGGGGRKRRRMDSESSHNLSFEQKQQKQMQQPAQAQQYAAVQQPSTALPPAHSLTTSPSSLTTRKTIARTSFSDLLQLFDAQELKEAIATGSVFEDDLAAQSALPGLAPYAADVFGDMGMNIGGMSMGGGLMGSGSSLVYDDLLAGIGLGGEEEQHHPVKMPSSIAGSYHGSAASGSGSGSGRSSRNEVQQQQQQQQQQSLPQQQATPSRAYEMMTSDVSLPAETRDELRVAYPSGSTPAQPAQLQQHQSYHQPQQQQQSYQPAAYTPNASGIYQAQMMPTASVEVTPRSSNVHNTNMNNTYTNATNLNNTNVHTTNMSNTNTFPSRYNNPQDYHHQPLPSQSIASQYRFVESLEFSTQSERLLREWDRSMGLKACHSKTMLRTSKSRKKLLDKAGSVGAFVYAAKVSEGGAVAATGGGMVGSSYPPSQAHYQPNAYAPNAYYNNPSQASMGYAPPYTHQEKKEDDSAGDICNRSTSHDSFQDQIEKNSQTATMA